MENSVEGKSRETDVGAYNFYVNYIGKKCTVHMTDWNDGISELYLLNQDEIFLYYATIGKKKAKVGALAKQYIERIIFSGLFGEQTEMLDPGILDIKEVYVRLVSGKKLKQETLRK